MVFAQRGYEATSVEEIAARAGISKPIVYEHFGGKEGLYAVIVDREVEHIVGRIVEAISSGSPRERLERAALAFLVYVKERPGGFAVLLRDVPAPIKWDRRCGCARVRDRAPSVLDGDGYLTSPQAVQRPQHPHAAGARGRPGDRSHRGCAAQVGDRATAGGRRRLRVGYDGAP